MQSLWIQLSADEINAIRAARDVVARSKCEVFVPIGAIVERIEKQLAEQSSDEANKYRAAAQATAREGDLEVDESATVSFGDDPGAYIMSWKWIYESDL